MARTMGLPHRLPTYEGEALGLLHALQWAVT